MNTLHSLLTWTLDVSLRASLLAGAVLCLQAALRGHVSARWRYAMWLPVLFVLLAPVLPESRWSAELWFMGKDEAVVQDVVVIEAPSDELPLMELHPTSPTIAVATVAPLVIDWQQVMAVAWLSGLVVIGGGGISFYLAEMRRIRRSASPVSEALETLAQRLARELKLRRVPEIVSSSRVASPAVAGPWRSVVLLPLDFEKMFTPDEAELVLRHEFMHLKRWDLPLNALLCVLQALHWFNPLLWFVAARVREDREAACDAQVLASSLEDCRNNYGLALLKVQSAGRTNGWCLGMVGVFSSRAAVRSRIAAIARYERTRPWKGMIAASAILGLAVIGATHAEAPNFHIGASEFAKGDSIRITSVNRSDKLIAVSGDYELASQDEATLGFFITASDPTNGRTKTDPQQRLKVKQGKGTFTLAHPNPYAGMPHVSFYPIKGGEVLGGIYFGTQEEAEASKKMKSGTAQPKRTQGNAAAVMNERFAAYKALLSEVQKLQKESMDPSLTREARAKAAEEFNSKLKEARALEKEMQELQQTSSTQLKMGQTATGSPSATVDGKVILSSDVAAAITAQRQTILFQHRDNPSAATEALAKLNTTALNSLIDRELVLAEFKRIGGSIKPSTLDDDTNKLIKEQFKGDREDFTAQLAKQGVTMEKFREMREKLIIVQIMRSKYGGKPDALTDDDVQRYYDAHQAQWRTRGRLKLSTITIPKHPAEQGSTIEKQKQLAADLHAKLVGGADFAALARAHSQDSRSVHGGAWDEMAISPAMRELAMSTQVGAVPPVIDDKTAFIILRVDDKKPGTVSPLDSVKAEIEKKIKAERSAAEVEKWLAGLRAKADVKRFE